MSFKQGDVYTCPDTNCGCEITVTREARLSQGNHAHVCCCGKEMKRKGGGGDV